MTHTDQLHRQVIISNPPKRIVSLVPSTTELLFDLGLDHQIVGVTQFCIFPAKGRKEKVVIGGTKTLKLDRIRKLKPDLIIADKEENTKEQIEELAKEFPVWVSNIRQFDDAIEMIIEIGLITGTQQLAQKMIAQIQSTFINSNVPTTKSVAYFIWQKPLMVAGSETFIHEMIEKAGYTNAFGAKNRYPVINEALLQEAQPDLIFLSSEPYPFAEKHLKYFQNLQQINLIFTL